MTTRQKRLRVFARQAGKRAARYLRFALYPVIEDDFETWLPNAINAAREAWRFALLSHEEAAQVETE